jgi:oligoribonuclease NrnB/cAMP/cGMP phosphodiesterase (DHH superfamily)
MNKKQTLILYHADCLDGFGAAYAAWRYFGDKAEYVPVNYGQRPPEVVGKDVFILDFSYQRDTLAEMKNEANRILVLDHHKTAEADLKGLDFAVFDMERSGCVMAWDYFFDSRTRPFGLELIQDRDLWRFNFSQTKAFNEALRNLVPRAFNDWHEHLDVLGARILADRGKDLLAVFNADINSLIKRAHRASLGDVAMIVCNAPPKYASELGNLMATRTELPAAVYSFNGATGQFDYSLRSVGEFDVSELAKEFGGGGHKNAAGFSLSYCAFDL